MLLGKAAEIAGDLDQVRPAIHDIVATGDTTSYSSQYHTLQRLLHEVPQIDSNGALRYLITGGMAVELFTRTTRQHHDLDVVLMGEDSTWEIPGSGGEQEEVEALEMKFDRLTIAENAVPVKIPNDRVLAFSPAMLMVQRVAAGIGRKPSSQTRQDARVLRDYVNLSESMIIKYDHGADALKLLPQETRNITTIELLRLFGIRR